MKFIELTDIHNRPCAISIDEIATVRSTEDGKATRITPKNGPAIMVLDSARSIIDRMAK